MTLHCLPGWSRPIRGYTVSPCLNLPWILTVLTSACGFLFPSPGRVQVGEGTLGPAATPKLGSGCVLVQLPWPPHRNCLDPFTDPSLRSFWEGFFPLKPIWLWAESASSPSDTTATGTRNVKEACSGSACGTDEPSREALIWNPFWNAFCFGDIKILTQLSDGSNAYFFQHLKQLEVFSLLLQKAD